MNISVMAADISTPAVAWFCMLVAAVDLFVSFVTRKAHSRDFFELRLLDITILFLGATLLANRYAPDSAIGKVLGLIGGAAAIMTMVVALKSIRRDRARRAAAPKGASQEEGLG